MSLNSLARRAAVAVAGGALVATGLGLVGPAPAAHAAPASPQAQAAAAWLANQLDSGLFTTGFDAVGTTIDFGLSLARTGADPTTLAEVTDGVEGVLDSYIGTVESPNASKLAKAAALYQAAGADLSDVGGVDFVERLEDAVDDTGQLGDSPDVYGQAWAVKVLDAVDSDEAEAATDFLISQKCEGGAWGYEYDGCNSAVDGTSYVVLALLPQQDDPDVATALDDAITWLKGQRRADGGFGDWGVNKNGTTSEANGTGLAAWALGEAGETALAEDAAAWVADHQLTGVTGCAAGPVPGENGALAYDDANIELAIAEGITDADRGTWIIAGAQSLAGLAYLPERTATVAKVSGPTTFVRAGTTVTVTVWGVRPGRAVCLTGFGTTQWKLGNGTAKVKLPAASGDRVLTLRQVDGTSTATIRALAAKTMKVLAHRATVARNGTQSVAAAGFVPGETVTITYLSKVVSRGKAAADGRYRGTFKVGATKGKRTILVRGEFPVRRGTTTFQVR